MSLRRASQILQAYRSAYRCGSRRKAEDRVRQRIQGIAEPKERDGCWPTERSCTGSTARYWNGTASRRASRLRAALWNPPAAGHAMICSTRRSSKADPMPTRWRQDFNNVRRHSALRVHVPAFVRRLSLLLRRSAQAALDQIEQMDYHHCGAPIKVSAARATGSGDGENG